jgi:hypothetical protein
LTLVGALAHQAGIAAGTDDQRKGVQQDRLAGTGLARERGKPRRKIDVEPFDQHYVADR